MCPKYKILNGATDNYKKIMAEVNELIESELERMVDTPWLAKLMIQSKQVSIGVSQWIEIVVLIGTNKAPFRPSHNE
mgnify:CR=1 FL=1